MNIINLMPVYKQAPVSLQLVKQGGEAAIKKIVEAAGADGAILVPAGHELVEAIKAAAGETKVVECDPTLGFVYTNNTAAAKTLEGEKPIPGAVNGEAMADVVVRSGAEVLTAEGKRTVWFEGVSAPVELNAKVSVADLVSASGVADAKAVYVGYPQGDFFKADDSVEVELTSDYVRVYGAKNCMAEAVRAICAQYRQETCGRCVFGHEGSHQIATIMEDICKNKGRATDPVLIKDLGPVMQTQCLCEQGRIMAKTVLTAFDLFGDEIEQHFTKHNCPAGECSAYMTVHILPTKCTGCGDCIDACEEDAILGKPHFIHVIDQKACTQCGACIKACDEEAIITAGADKPRTPPRPIPIRKR